MERGSTFKKNKKLFFTTDKEAVVYEVNKKTSK